MNQPITIIRAKNQSLLEAVKEFWDYRELLYMLTLRRISVRYKQTVVGVAWVLIQPLVAMTIFNVIFGRLIQMPSGGIPYPIFVYSALVLWGLFSEGLSRSGLSLIGEAQLISKVYFPRMMIPFSAVLSAWVDFTVSLFLLLPLTFFYGLRPTWSLLLIPVVMVTTIFLTMGAGLFLAALNVRYRDFQYVIPFLLQVLTYASPIVYSIEIVPPHLHFWYYLNPLAGLIDAFRFAVTGQTAVSWFGFAWSALSAAGFLAAGSWVFRRVEREFADYV
ncbi:MAG: ABC transporter permease [Cyanobacteriota bacterium]|jgi:lipopolysaccharide transport system permease protein